MFIFAFIIGIAFVKSINKISILLTNPLNSELDFFYSYRKKEKRKNHLRIYILFDNLLLIAKKINRRSNLVIDNFMLEVWASSLFVICLLSKPTNFIQSEPLFLYISGWTLLYLLLLITVIDIKYLLIPESLCRIGIILGLTFNFINCYKFIGDYSLMVEITLASISGYFLFLFISSISYRILDKLALGLGDAKLAAIIGSWLGLKGLFLCLLIGFLSSGTYSLIGLLTKRIRLDKEIPFAPFLTASCFSVWVMGNEFWIKHFLLNL